MIKFSREFSNVINRIAYCLCLTKFFFVPRPLSFGHRLRLMNIVQKMCFALRSVCFSSYITLRFSVVLIEYIVEIICYNNIILCGNTYGNEVLLIILNLYITSI